MKDTTADFEEFVAVRSPRLLRAAWLLTGDPHLAEDLLQMTLAQVWPKWDRIAGGREAYVRRALVNCHGSSMRRRWHREVPYGDLPDRPDQHDVFDEVLTSATVSRAVRALAPRRRAVVELRYYEDLSVGETAATLGCSKGTVKSQTFKALYSLRGLLPEHDPATAAGRDD
ncbi:SigE family RNA polymerase sigma factor [Kitasatospora sp. NPDC088346]|uniref:SigE family RNA polymerase sigma factor n=1 Tax=Kitasatospora sp. NPDC088346 TaxID=3364073 RepID=UPI00380F25E4